MRRSTPLAVLLCTVVVLGTAAAGIALAGGSGAPAGTLAAVAGSAAVPPTSTSSAAESGEPGSTAGLDAAGGPPATVVTVPALPSSVAALPAAPAPSPSPPTPDPAPPVAEPAAPEPALAPPAAVPPTAVPPTAVPPADVPVVAPYATVIGWHGEDKVAYLTFDDGPGPATGRVLDILAASGVKATFCQVGLRVAEAPDVTRRVVADGHTLCNHSWDHHSPFDSLSPAELDGQIGRTQDAFVQAVGIGARYFRAPEGAFGAAGGSVLQAGQRARTIPLGWGVDSLDWRKPGVDAIVTNVLAAVSPGAVILLHDGGGTDREQTLAALPGIISGLRAAGYTLAAMPPDPVG